MKAPEKIQKVTVNLPTDLLQKAKKSSGKGTTETIREGLKLVAAQNAYRRLEELRGKVPHLMDYDELKRLRE